jgi:hypothetical protein
VCGAALTGATAALPADAQAAVTQRAEALIEQRAVESYQKEQRERGALREALEKVSELLMTRCTYCKIPSMIDFSQCMALTCQSCNRHFCAFCDVVAPPRGDLHGHVIEQHRDLAPRGKDHVLFVTKAHYAAWKRKSQAAAINRLVDALESERDREELRRRVAEM